MWRRKKSKQKEIKKKKANGKKTLNIYLHCWTLKIHKISKIHFQIPSTIRFSSSSIKIDV